MHKYLTATAVAVGIGVGALMVGAIGPVAAQSAAPPSTSSSSSTTGSDSQHPARLRTRLRARFIRDAARVASDKIGVPVSDLRQAVCGGQSIAEVASAHDVNPDDVKKAIVDDITAKIDQAVTNGHLSTDRAAKLEERLPNAVDRLMNFKRSG